MAIVVKELDKTYRIKKGADVRALKDVSFNLPDKGMVFILGKSGCGKSTLLNLLGGLDGFDGGDIVIDEKSIKDYKATDLDRYRNDYVGFVFQENNLLEKDSVKRNVSLALELQSGKDTDGKVDTALESVGLKDFADRKCNQLSGGQKQRVAIARALIKQPKLLLCDEPTGALDSETGEDIFTLLKELSGERLVVVVSHDRESAEKYGDRVIELKDGEIISDSATLEEEKPAEEKTVEKKHGGLHFVRAFTMGLSYIIARPIRMAICLLLCLVTFVFVGVADAINAYDRDKAMLYTMEEAGSTHYSFGKKNDKEGHSFRISEMSLSEADELSGLISVDRVDYIFEYGLLFGVLREVGGPSEKNYAKVNNYLEAYGSFCEDYGFTLLAGRLPENTGEAALPLYLYNYFKTYGYDGGYGAVAVNSYEDLIGKTVSFSLISLQSFTVTGIIDTHFNFEKQAEILFGETPKNNEHASDIGKIELDVIHNTIFVCNGYNDYIWENFSKYLYEEAAVSRVIAPFNGSNKQKLKNIRVYTTQYGGKPVSADNNYGACYRMASYIAQQLDEAEMSFSFIYDYSIYLCIGLVTVTALFIMYYASGTINDKRREIGILRALGASRGDIVKIIGSEHGTFTTVAVAIALIIGAICTVVLNNSFTAPYGIGIVLIKFGIRQVAVVAAVAILAVAVGIAVPLYKLLKAKPVDVIADRK